MSRLPVPRTPAGRQGLAALLARPELALVGLDFDGTLAPIAARPEDARPVEGTVEALAELAGLIHSVVIVTGRPVRDVLRLGGFAGATGLGSLTVLGQYGLERWDAATGSETVPEPLPGIAEVRTRLPALLGELGAPDGTAIEDKHLSLVVHVRRAADPRAALQLVSSPVSQLAERHGLVAAAGRNVLELRPPGMDKGAALREIVAERGPGSVLFGGDDLGDLPAFDAVEVMRDEGLPGLTVCSASDEVTEVAERADVVVAGPAGVLELLRSLAAHLSEGAGTTGRAGR